MKAATGIDLDATRRDGVDASQALHELAQVSGSIATLGTERVRGVETTHYRGPIDVAAAAAKSGALTGPALRLAQRLGIVPFDVWVDAQGRVRRIRYSLSGDKLGSSDVPADALLTYTFELWDFGTPIHVVAPPAAEVVSADAYRAFAKGLGRAA